MWPIFKKKYDTFKKVSCGNTVMGDNRTKLFISHCGSNGLHEAMYHTVPIIGFPLFAEQPRNAFVMEQFGFGKRLNIKTVTVQQLVDTMKLLLADESIKKNLRKVSSIIKERPLPSETVANAIEHVMKYGGEHLRPASINMPIYELYMLDVFAVIGICIFGVFITIYSILKLIFRVICRSSAKDKKKSD